MAAVSEITVDTRREAGDTPATIEKVKFKLYDKKGALDSLSRHLGLFEKDNAQRSEPVTKIIVETVGSPRSDT